MPLALTVENTLAGSIVVTKISEQGDPLLGACFDAYTDRGGGIRGTFISRGCNANGNVITVEGLATGPYVLTESKSPIGYLKADDVLERSRGSAVLSDSDRHPDDQTDHSQARCRRSAAEGLLFGVFKDPGNGTRGQSVVGHTCDNADGEDDGFLAIPVSVGNYVLAELEASPNYLLAPDQQFTIVPLHDTPVDVYNQVGGVLYIQKIDEVYWWVEGACFEVFVNIGGGSRGASLGKAWIPPMAHVTDSLLSKDFRRATTS